MQNQFLAWEGAAAELAAHGLRLPPESVMGSLSSGLTQLRDLLITRLHEDVERQFGVDSLVAPMSPSQEAKQIQRAGVEIDTYSAVVVAEEVARSSYVDCQSEWLLEWIFRLRFGDGCDPALKEYASPYCNLSDSGRRLRFASVLQSAVPESFKTPRVLFLLFPQCVRIVAALAFGDPQRAEELRAEQVDLLAAIGDCRACGGRVLENHEQCGSCGNPLWTFACLRSV